METVVNTLTNIHLPETCTCTHIYRYIELGLTPQPGRHGHEASDKSEGLTDGQRLCQEAI